MTNKVRDTNEQVKHFILLFKPAKNEKAVDRQQKRGEKQKTDPKDHLLFECIETTPPGESHF